METLKKKKMEKFKKVKVEEKVSDRSVVLQILGSPHWQAGICSSERRELMLKEISPLTCELHLSTLLRTSGTAKRTLSSESPSAYSPITITIIIIVTQLRTTAQCKGKIRLILIPVIMLVGILTLKTMLWMQKSCWFRCWLGHSLVQWTVGGASESVKASREPSSTKVVPVAWKTF